MALTGEYELSPEGWVRDQTEKIFQTGTTDSVDIKGRPVVLVTMRGAKSGKLRKVPLMRVVRTCGSRTSIGASGFLSCASAGTLAAAHKAAAAAPSIKTFICYPLPNRMAAPKRRAPTSASHGSTNGGPCCATGAAH